MKVLKEEETKHEFSFSLAALLLLQLLCQNDQLVEKRSIISHRLPHIKHATVIGTPKNWSYTAKLDKVKF